MESGLSELTVEKVLSRIHYYRCHDYIELVALVNLLPDVVRLHPKVKRGCETFIPSALVMCVVCVVLIVL